MIVLRVTNENRLGDLVKKRGNRMICPVNDGNGDLILPVDVLDDPEFDDLRQSIIDVTEEIEYVAFPDNEAAIQGKIAEFESNGKAIKIDMVKEEVEHKGKKIKIDKKPKEPTVEKETKPKKQ